ncbi:MAG: hypothetical protein AB3N11_01825 [Arenibacterium sp.]
MQQGPVSFAWAIAFWPFLAHAAFAEPMPFFSDRQPFIALDQPAPGTAAQASLFVDRAESGLFAPWPEARATPLPRALSGSAQRVARQIRDLIGQAEAGRAGYDAVQWGATIKPLARPTAMTLAEIDQWIRDTPGQPHAIGRYQFIPKTLRWLVQRLGLPSDTRFTAQVQDRLADLLLADAGLEDVLRGEIDRITFMRNLARIWAGFPLPNGQSYYEGFAGNKATMSWRRFADRLDRILS